MQDRGRVPSFDFVKLGGASTDAALLRDAASRSILCNARCVFAVAGGDAQGATATAWADFVAVGCPKGDRFREIRDDGPVRVACRDSVRL